MHPSASNNSDQRFATGARQEPSSLWRGHVFFERNGMNVPSSLAGGAPAEMTRECSSVTQGRASMPSTCGSDSETLVAPSAVLW